MNTNVDSWLFVSSKVFSAFMARVNEKIGSTWTIIIKREIDFRTIIGHLDVAKAIKQYLEINIRNKADELKNTHKKNYYFFYGENRLKWYLFNWMLSANSINSTPRRKEGNSYNQKMLFSMQLHNVIFFYFHNKVMTNFVVYVSRNIIQLTMNIIHTTGMRGYGM